MFQALEDTIRSDVLKKRRELRFNSQILWSNMSPLMYILYTWYLYIDNMFHGPSSPFLFRKSLGNCHQISFLHGVANPPNLKHRLSGFSGYTFLEHLFQNSRHVFQPPTQWCHSSGGHFAWKKPGLRWWFQRGQTHSSRWLKGVISRKNSQALSIEGLSIAEGDIIFKRVFLYVFETFFEWFLGRNDLTFLDEGDFDAKKNIHLKHLL